MLIEIKLEYSVIKLSHCCSIKGCQKILDVNPFPPSAPIWHRLAKLSILNLEGIIKKNSYKRRDCESVDVKSLS